MESGISTAHSIEIGVCKLTVYTIGDLGLVTSTWGIPVLGTHISVFRGFSKPSGGIQRVFRSGC